MVTEPVKTFARRFRGYEPAAVDAHIEALNTRQQLLRDDVESLRARLTESGEQAAALRKEVDVLIETSDSPHAVQQRMAKMLRRAVDEVSQMQAEAQAEADALIAEARAEADAERRKHEESVAGLTARQQEMEAEYADTKQRLEAELAAMRAETRTAIDEAWQESQREREQLLADTKQEADHYREQARRAVVEAARQRIRVLEQLMGVYRDLESIPAALEAAQDAELTYGEHGTPADTNGSTGRKVNAG